MARDVAGPESFLWGTGTRESSNLQGFMCQWEASEEGFVSTVGSKPLFKSQFDKQGYITHGTFCLDGNPSSDKHL